MELELSLSFAKLDFLWYSAAAQPKQASWSHHRLLINHDGHFLQWMINRQINIESNTLQPSSLYQCVGCGCCISTTWCWATVDFQNWAEVECGRVVAKLRVFQCGGFDFGCFLAFFTFSSQSFVIGLWALGLTKAPSTSQTSALWTVIQQQIKKKKLQQLSEAAVTGWLNKKAVKCHRSQQNKQLGLWRPPSLLWLLIKSCLWLWFVFPASMVSLSVSPLWEVLTHFSTHCRCNLWSALWGNSLEYAGVRLTHKIEEETTCLV